MDEYINSGNQSDKQLIQNKASQNQAVNLSTEKSKFNLWKVIAFTLFLIIIGVLGVYLYSKAQKPSKNTYKAKTQTVIPTNPALKTAIFALAYLKDGAIYTADFYGKSEKVFEIQSEELNKPNNLYIKISPDKNYLAFIGTSGGLDSALKIINIKQKKKISERVYGSAGISDFDWSPDSKKIVAAVNLKNNEKDFTSALYLIDPFMQYDMDLLFKTENIDITQIEWPNEQNIYYSRIAYAPLQNAAIVRYDLKNKSRNPVIIESTSELYKDISAFTIKFLISSDRNNVIAYTSMKDEARRSRGTSYNLSTLSLPGLEKKPDLINYVLPDVATLYKNYIVGIERPYGSPDSSVFLLNIPQSEDKLNLLDMGPSGAFHFVKVIEQDGKAILLVWSEFDNIHTISAYDYENLIETRKNTGTAEPLWKLNNATSFDL